MQFLYSVVFYSLKDVCYYLLIKFWFVWVTVILDFMWSCVLGSLLFAWLLSTDAWFDFTVWTGSTSSVRIRGQTQISRHYSQTILVNLQMELAPLHQLLFLFQQLPRVLPHMHPLEHMEYDYSTYCLHCLNEECLSMNFSNGILLFAAFPTFSCCESRWFSRVDGKCCCFLISSVSCCCCIIITHSTKSRLEIFYCCVGCCGCNVLIGRFQL